MPFFCDVFNTRAILITACGLQAGIEYRRLLESMRPVAAAAVSGSRINNMLGRARAYVQQPW